MFNKVASKELEGQHLVTSARVRHVEHPEGRGRSIRRGWPSAHSKSRLVRTALNAIHLDEAIILI
jgi:hypothetical protein